MDNQQPHGYMRTPPPPPPPLKADPYQRPSPSVPTRPPANRWPYSATQFQYQPQTQHSPSPPPPQWPPPQSSDHAPYPPHYSVHQPPPYPAHPHYPPPQPLPPRPPPAPPFYTQDWESSWTQRNWQYPTNNIEEDWGAKAKAWLAAKATTENQNPSPQILSGGGTEGKYQYSEQYSQANDPHTPLASISNYQLYSGAVGPQNQAGVCQTQESQYTSAGQSSYVADMHVAFAARDGSNGGDSVTSINPLVHQQEVPSSYSSVAGNEEVGDRYEKYNSFSPQTVGPLPHQHVQPLPPGQAGWMEGPHNFGSMPKETPSDLRDQPLNFALFTHNLDPHAQPHCDISSGGSVRDGEPTVAVSSNYAWPSCTAPGAAYPPVAPSIPLASQVDHPIALPSLASGHLSPMFPTGPAFQPTVTTMGAAFGVGVGVTPPPTAIFGDAYGVSERPKKASVPNWLKEEIIKNKAVIASSTIEIPKDDPQSIEEDSSFDKSSNKGYQGDSKSIDSSRSAEDEDEDEDEIEAARTAAINQEIKRVLTEVLMKVTDELFDEIATKVLNEDNLSVEVGCDVGLSSHQILPSKQSVSTPKASAKILVPIMTKESGYGDASEQSTSSPPGDVLGLGSYASDEEDEDKQSNSKEISNHLQPSSCKPFKGNSVNDNGFPMEATEEQSFPAKLDADSICIKSPVSVTPDGSVANMELSDFKEPGEFASNDDGRSSKRFSRITQEELQHGPDISTVNNSLDKRVVEKNKDDNLYAEKMANDDSKIQETRRRYVKNVTLGNKKCSFKEDHKDSKSSKERLEKGNEEQGRHLRTERMDYHNTSKDKDKEKSKTNGKVKNCLLEKGNEEQGRHLRTERMDYHNNSKDESRKRRSPLGGKEGNIETRSDSRASGKKNSDRREDRTRNEIRERSRHKTESETSRHKRRRSPSVGFKDRDSKDNSLVNRANDSGEESSDDSRRKSHHLKRRKSPSPVRSRKRHVSRSPHSKHSKRRHSPYSYLDTARRKRSASRSRSRSPIHRRR